MTTSAKDNKEITDSIELVITAMESLKNLVMAQKESIIILMNLQKDIIRRVNKLEMDK